MTPRTAVPNQPTSGSTPAVPRRCRTFLGAILLALTAVTLSGCMNYRYGWQQEKQALRGWRNSVKASITLVNEPSHSYCAWAYGLKKERHQAPQWSDNERGFIKDRKILLCE
ncbi:MAG: hypothetical protein AAF581_16365 [Planctomycetota bacterium]